MWQFPKGSFQEGMLTSGPDFINSYCILLLIILSQISSLSWCIREWFREGFRRPIRKLHETECRIAESWLGVLFHCLESFITYLYSSTFNNFDL
ncbi:unnamed protein product, partial [Vitis vinifera]|uniref:Uncharacterized protein n=1 Tax=Vitis vinifera TaxID=29760 RepID=D7UDR7_VITVI